MHDPLSRFRDQFALPVRPDGSPWIYLAGNSLGLMPRAARAAVGAELDKWETLAVEAHFHGDDPWYTAHEWFRAPMARVVGALPDEVTLMNALTVNLHLLLASFWQPRPGRTRIVVEEAAFPSDTYAVESHVAVRGHDPAEVVTILRPEPGEVTLRMEAIEAFLEREGESVALVLMGGVHYYTGQRMDLARITAAAHRAGALAGFDLAHAAGNVPLELHDWDVDFAAWCTYKYLNAGPGAIAGVFVHQRHGLNTDLPRFAGWWGNDPATRFQMHQIEHFTAHPGADGWQVSNPPVLARAPLAASLALFDQAGMPALREKSVRLTAHLERRLHEAAGDRARILTPADPEARGAQLSILVPARSREVFEALLAAGVLPDYRPPDVIRMAPVPLYNTFEEMDRVSEVWGRVLS